MKIVLIPIFIVLLDQISKISIKIYWINNDLFFSKINVLGNYLRFVFIENPGIAFGIDTSRFHIFIVVLTIIAILFISYQLYKSIFDNHYEKISLSFILGGAIGNLIDRTLVLFTFFNYNGVIDFIDIGFSNYRWFTFNIADASITIGIIIFIYQT